LELRGRGLLGVLSSSILFASTPARANGRFPATNQLVVDPSDANVLVLRATFGLLVSRDAGQSWGWICESALGSPDSEEDPAVGVTANGTILAATYEGMATSSDTGCAWAFASDLSGWVSADVAVHPDNPDHAVSLAWQQHTDDAGLSTFETHVFQTLDDGLHWSPASPSIDPTALLQTVDVAASDPNRIYACGVHGIYETENAALYVSRDGGSTFVESAVPIEPKLESAAYIAAVDPQNADRIYLRTWPISRLLVSDDAGQTFSAPLSFAGEMQGFALSPDGTTIYAGGPDDGLWVGDAATLSFTQVSSTAIQCLATAGTRLYACSDDTVFALGQSNDEGRSFTPLLHLASASRVVTCPPATSASVCTAEAPSLCAMLPACEIDASDGIVEPTDSGTRPPEASSASLPSAPAGCACALPAVGSPSARTSGALLFGWLGLAAARHRSRKRMRAARDAANRPQEESDAIVQSVSERPARRPAGTRSTWRRRGSAGLCAGDRERVRAAEPE